MLEHIIGFVSDADYILLNKIENTLTEVYGYNTHHIELSNNITDLLDNKDVNTFYRNTIELYKTTVNKLLSIIGIVLSNDATLQDKADFLKGLADLNNKDPELKSEAYNMLENYPSNLEKLAFLLRHMHTLDNIDIITAEIFTVEDYTIELLEDMLKGNDESGLKDNVLQSVLKNIVRSIAGDIDEEDLEIISESIGEPINVMVSKHNNLLYVESTRLINNIIAIIAFSSNRYDSTVAFMSIADRIPDEYSENLHTFILPMLDKLKLTLEHKGLKDVG